MGDREGAQHWEGVPYGGPPQAVGNDVNPYMYHYVSETGQPAQQPQRSDSTGQQQQSPLDNEKQQYSPQPQPHHQQQPLSPQQTQPPWDNSNSKEKFETGAGAPHSQTQVCRHFLQGRCAFGYNCRFSHNVDPSMQPTMGGTPEGGAGGAVPQGYTQDPYYYGQNPYPYGGAGMPPYYAGYPGYYGAPHQPYAGHYGYGYVPGMAGHMGAPTEHAPKARVPCRYFRQGICKYGGECRFSHEL